MNKRAHICTWLRKLVNVLKWLSLDDVEMVLSLCFSLFCIHATSGEHNSDMEREDGAYRGE